MLLSVVIGGMLLLLGSALTFISTPGPDIRRRLELAFFSPLEPEPHELLLFRASQHRDSELAGLRALATLIALLVGIPAAYLLATPRKRLRAILDPLFMLPLGTSAVTLGFGYIIALDKPPLNLPRLAAPDSIGARLDCLSAGCAHPAAGPADD